MSIMFFIFAFILGLIWGAGLWDIIEKRHKEE